MGLRGVGQLWVKCGSRLEWGVTGPSREVWVNCRLSVGKVWVSYLLSISHTRPFLRPFTSRGSTMSPWATNRSCAGTPSGSWTRRNGHRCRWPGPPPGAAGRSLVLGQLVASSPGTTPAPSKGHTHHGGGPGVSIARPRKRQWTGRRGRRKRQRGHPRNRRPTCRLPGQSSDPRGV